MFRITSCLLCRAGVSGDATLRAPNLVGIDVAALEGAQPSGNDAIPSPLLMLGDESISEWDTAVSSHASAVSSAVCLLTTSFLVLSTNFTLLVPVHPSSDNGLLCCRSHRQLHSWAFR